MVWKQWPIILATWVILTCVALLVVHKWPDVYRSETLVLVESQKIPENLVASTVNAELQDRLATISQQMLSSTRLKKIIDKFHLYQDLRKRNTDEEIIEQMRASIKIKLERGWTRNQPGAFRITYSGANPETTAAVANDISNLFIEENLRSREIQASGTSEFIESQLQQAKKSLEEQEAKVSKYKQEHNGQLPEQELSVLSMLDRLRTQLQGSQDAILHAQQSRQMLEGTLEAAEASKSALITGSLTASGTLSSSVNPLTGATASNTLLRHSEGLKQELENLRFRYTEAHPLVREMKTRLAAELKTEAIKDEQAKADEQIRLAETAKLRSSPTPALMPARVSPEMAQLLMRDQERISGLKTQLTLAIKDVETREDEHKRILAAIADCQARVEKLPIRQQEMAGLMRDYEFSKDNYKNLLNKNFSADIASDMEKRQKAERFTILDPARVSEKPAKPNRPVLNAVSVIVALGLALVLGCAREWKKNVILGEWELPGDVPVLGRIPAMAIGNQRLMTSSKRSTVSGWKLGLAASLIGSALMIFVLLTIRRG